MEHGFQHYQNQLQSQSLDHRQMHALRYANFFEKDTLDVMEEILEENENNALLELGDYDTWPNRVLELGGYYGDGTTPEQRYFPSWYELVEKQLAFLDFSENEHEIAMFLLARVDDRTGLIAELGWLQTAQIKFRCSFEIIESVRYKLMRHLDPTGICANSIFELITFQLEEQIDCCSDHDQLEVLKKLRSAVETNATDLNNLRHNFEYSTDSYNDDLYELIRNLRKLIRLPHINEDAMFSDVRVLPSARIVARVFNPTTKVIYK